MNRRSLLLIGIVTLFLTAGVAASYADSLDKIEIIKISARDKQAILKMDDGKMRIVKLGEEIMIKAETETVSQASDQKTSEIPKSANVKKTQAAIQKLKVAEISADKIVLEKTTKDGPETIIMSLVHQTSAGNKNQDSKDKKQMKPEMKTEIYRIVKQPQKHDVPMLPNQNIKKGEAEKGKAPVTNIQNNDIKK